MQRWIAVSLIVLVLLIGGAGYGYWAVRQNRPYPVWVPLPINPEAPVAMREESARMLKSKLGEREVLIKVSKDLGLPRKWHLATDEDAAAELGRRLFVDATEVTINIGMAGKKKEKALTGEIVTRLMEDVKKILGVKAPAKPES